MADDYTVTERVYERREDGRTVLAAVPGDVIPGERAKELGLVGKGEKVEMPPIEDPHLIEGIEPLEGPEADARATGETAEAKARAEAEQSRKSSRRR